MVAQEEALVGGVDHDGVGGEAFGVEVIKQAADVVVHTLNAAKVIFDVNLVGPFAQGIAFEIGREVTLDVGLEHVFAHLQGDGGDAARASFVVVEEVVGLGDVAIGEQVLIFGGGLPGAVRRFVVAHGEEGLLRVALFEPVEGEIADQIGAIAGVLFAAGGCEEGGDCR